MHLLADDFDGYGKLIGIVVFGIIWGIGAISSMVKKANEQAKKNAAMKVPPSQAQMMQTPARASAAKQAGATQKRPPKIPPKAARPTTVVRQPATPVSSAPPPLAPQAAPVVVRQASLRGAKVAQATTSGTGAKPAPGGGSGGATAATLRRWLVPATMRKQFILTELLQPPLALRDQPLSHDPTKF